jgi:hypothetical protein
MIHLKPPPPKPGGPGSHIFIPQEKGDPVIPLGMDCGEDILICLHRVKVNFKVIL